MYIYIFYIILYNLYYIILHYFSLICAMHIAAIDVYMYINIYIHMYSYVTNEIVSKVGKLIMSLYYFKFIFLRTAFKFRFVLP